MGLLGSINKSYKVYKLSKKMFLASNSFDVGETIRCYQNGELTIQDKAEKELFDMCYSDRDNVALIDSYGYSRKDLEGMFSKLRRAGAGVMCGGGHYVAASTFLYGCSLDYLLKTEKAGKDIETVAIRLIQYFKNAETGFLDKNGLKVTLNQVIQARKNEKDKTCDENANKESVNQVQNNQQNYVITEIACPGCGKPIKTSRRYGCDCYKCGRYIPPIPEAPQSS